MSDRGTVLAYSPVARLVGFVAMLQLNYLELHSKCICLCSLSVQVTLDCISILPESTAHHVSGSREKRFKLFSPGTFGSHAPSLNNKCIQAQAYRFHIIKACLCHASYISHMSCSNENLPNVGFSLLASVARRRGGPLTMRVSIICCFRDSWCDPLFACLAVLLPRSTFAHVLDFYMPCSCNVRISKRSNLSR